MKVSVTRAAGVRLGGVLFDQPDLRRGLLNFPTKLSLAGAAVMALGTTGAAGTATATEHGAATSDHFMTLAHRGASGYAPEETMPAIDLAVAHGADWIELDIQLTADDRLVAFHDETVDRTTDGEGDLNDFTLAELQELDAGSWFNEENPALADPAFAGATVPTLREILEKYGHDINYYVETKSPDANPGLEEALVEMIEEYNLVETGSVIVQSFQQDSLMTVRELNASIPLVQLIWFHPEEYEEGADLVEWTGVTPGPEAITSDDWQDVSAYAQAVGTNLHYQDRQVIDESFVQDARAHGLGVHVYTINDTATMQRLKDWGATAIFTNFPDRSKALVD